MQMVMRCLFLILETGNEATTTGGTKLQTGQTTRTRHATYSGSKKYIYIFFNIKT